MVAKDELEPIRGTHPQWNIPHLCKGESRARLRTIWKKQPLAKVIQRKETRTFTNVRFVPSEGHSPQWTRPRGSSPISSTFNSSRMQNTERNINGATHLLLTQRHGGHKEKDEHRLRESKRCGATHRLLTQLLELGDILGAEVVLAARCCVHGSFILYTSSWGKLPKRSKGACPHKITSMLGVLQRNRRRCFPDF